MYSTNYKYRSTNTDKTVADDQEIMNKSTLSALGDKRMFLPSSKFKFTNSGVASLHLESQDRSGE